MSARDTNTRAQNPGRNRRHRTLVLASVVALGAFGVKQASETKAARCFSANFKVRHDIMALCDALDDYAIAHEGQYPPRLEALLVPGGDSHDYLTNGTLPSDPWGRNYQYDPILRSALESPIVLTLGRDGRIGGVHQDRDVSSRMMFSDVGLERCCVRAKPGCFR